MKTTALLIFCALISACSPDATPVDMEFDVSVETIEDTCGNDPAPEGLTVTLKVNLKTDDNMAIIYPTGYIPGHGNYKDIVIYDGKLEAKDTDPSHDPARKSFSMVGGLNMNSVDLVLEEERWLKEDGSESATCVRKARLKGAARPFSTASAPDGKYEAYYDFYGQVCPPGQPYDAVSWTVPLDIRDRDDSALFAFDSHDEMLVFEMPTAMLASGNVDWSGLMYLVVRPAYFYNFEGKVVGDFQAGAYNLRMDFHDIGDGTGCNYVLKAAGAKRLPDQTKISNVYRLAVSKSDACKPDANGNPTTETFEQEGDVVLRTNGQLTLMHDDIRVNLDPQTDGTYTGHWTGAGRTLDYTATVVPPRLSFSYVWTNQTQNGTCRTAYEVAGVPRYFPNLALDFPKTTNLKPRLTESKPMTRGLAATLKDRGARLRPLSEAPQFVRETIRPRR